MPVLPEEITTASLRRRRRRRGYDPAQVEALLGRVGTDYAGTLDRIATLAEDRARYRADQQHLQRRFDEIGDSARAAAEQEASAAQRRLTEADRRAQRLEDAARDRWEAMRAETEKRFEHLQIAERRFADRIRHVEEILAAVRTEVQLGPPPPEDMDSPNGQR